MFPPRATRAGRNKNPKGIFHTHPHASPPPKDKCVSRTQSALKVQAPHGVSNSRHHVHTPLQLKHKNTNPKNLMCFSHTKCAQSSGTTWRVKLTPSHYTPLFYSEHNNTIADKKHKTHKIHTQKTHKTHKVQHTCTNCEICTSHPPTRYRVRFLLVSCSFACDFGPPKSPKSHRPPQEPQKTFIVR